MPHLFPKTRSIVSKSFSLIVAAVGALAVLSTVHAESVTPPFSADWVVAPREDATIGGPGNATLVLEPNTALLERVLVEPGDVRHATLNLTIAPPPRGAADELAAGSAADGAVVRLDDESALQQVHLGEGDALAIAVWRGQFHYHGGATLTDFTITRASDGKRTRLPSLADAPTAETDIGTFRLTGYAKRSKLPTIEKQGDVRAGREPGAWEVVDAKAVNLTSTSEGLQFFTQGQADFSAQFDWAPVLVFRPEAPAVYRVGGTLSFRSGQAADKNAPRTMRWIVMRVSAEGAKPQSGQLRLFRLTRPVDGGRTPTAGDDYAPQPLASVPLDEALAGKTQKVSLDGLADVARAWAAQPAAAHGLLLAVESPDAAHGRARVVVRGKEVAGRLAVLDRPAHRLFENPVRPRDGVYARMEGGNLYYGDDRLRLWGVVGYPDVGRLVNMGFNAQRVWNPSADRDMYDAESGKRGEVKPYVKGDGSRWDLADKHLAELRDAGCFVMFGSLTGTIPLKYVAVDGSFIAGGDDWAAWKQAVSVDKPDPMRWVLFDERLQEVRKRHARNLLTHVNPYTGKAYGQEEAIVIYEVFNENGAAKRLLEGSFESWPDYFRDKLQARWNAWLHDRYASGSALVAAWGKLAEGESLVRRSIALGPTFQRRNDFPEGRASDFVRFILEMIDDSNQDFRDYCRTLAPEGVGVNVAPFSFDTQYRPSLAWSYIQSRGEVNCPGMYFWDLDSTLDQPPSGYVIDSHTVEGTATVLYETNASRPNPARAEYPFKLAALASWQDWDGVFWHYWSEGGGAVDEAYLAKAMPYTTTSHYWMGVHHEVDPVMNAAIAAAGRMFLGQRIDPAPDPKVIEVGGEALYGYGRHHGVSQTQQTFASGSRLRFEPDSPEGVTIDGKPMPANERLTGAVAAGDEILWDWPNGRLIIDTPTAKAYAGRINGSYRFRDGIVLGDVSSPHVSFAMVSADGKPLTGGGASKRVYLTAVADAHNTGFQMDWSVRGGPVEQAKAILARGRAPVEVDRVAYSVWLPTEIDGRFQGYDYALRERVEATIAGTNRIEHDGRELFMAVLEIESRGAAAETPQAATSEAVSGAGAGAGDNAALESAVTGGGWNPIPGLSWNASHDEAHKTLRNSMFVFTSISPQDLSDEPSKRILLTDAELPTLWSAPADIEVVHDRERMQAITITFKQPPPFTQAVADYEARFGVPSEKKVASQYETSVARWPAVADRPAFVITESQGVLKIIYETEQ